MGYCMILGIEKVKAVACPCPSVQEVVVAAAPAKEMVQIRMKDVRVTPTLDIWFYLFVDTGHTIFEISHRKWKVEVEVEVEEEDR